MGYVCEEIFIDRMSEHLVLHRKCLVFVEHISVIVMWTLPGPFRCFLTYQTLSFNGNDYSNVCLDGRSSTGAASFDVSYAICSRRDKCVRHQPWAQKKMLVHILPRIRKLGGCYYADGGFI
jgi:hypothetical protein